jgi:hypothetical protein
MNLHGATLRRARIRVGLLVLLGLMASLLQPLPTQAAAPANDDVESATLIGALPFTLEQTKIGRASCRERV